MLVYIKVLPFQNGLSILGELDIVLSVYVRLNKQVITMMQSLLHSRRIYQRIWYGLHLVAVRNSSYRVPARRTHDRRLPAVQRR